MGSGPTVDPGPYGSGGPGLYGMAPRGGPSGRTAVLVALISAAAVIVAAVIGYVATTHKDGNSGDVGTGPTSAGSSATYTVQLAEMFADGGGDSGQGGTRLNLPNGQPFIYALSTMQGGSAGCQCVPPLNPAYMTVASTASTSCKSISLTIYVPWLPRDTGGSDQVAVVQNGASSFTATTTHDKQLETLNAPLNGGPFMIDITELAPAVTGDQASVYINGTLQCSTPTGR
jgi:hypothetical protein